jgi:hypothetical protein
VGFDAMFEAGQRAQVVHSGLADRAAPCRREIGLGVVEIHPLGAGGVGEAAGRHPQEHGFADPPRNLIAIHWRGVVRINDRLHLDLAAGVAEEPLHLAESHGSDAFESRDSAAEQLAG